jgi:hypothetical protein
MSGTVKQGKQAQQNNDEFHTIPGKCVQWPRSQKKSGLNRFRCHDLAHAPRKIKGLCNGRENRMQAPAANLNRFHAIRVRNVRARLRADAHATDQCAQAGAQKDHAPKSSGFFPGKALLIQLPHGIRKADKNNCGRR